MKNLIIVALFITITLANSEAKYDAIEALFNTWKKEFNKTYNSTKEEAIRLAVFTDNYLMIEKHNSHDHGTKLSLNKFADLSGYEFKDIHADCVQSHENDNYIKANTLAFDEKAASDLPKSIDWRTKNAVTPVKNQKQCASCWAFTATGVLEALYAIKNNKLHSFSEQQIIDCDKNSGGCFGGAAHKALEYTAQNGIESDSHYPYKGENDTCHFQASNTVKVNQGYSFLTNGSSNALKTALLKSPVAVTLQVEKHLFQFYKSGVIKTHCGADVDYAALVVGYDIIDGTEAFIVKHSWGDDWGDKGYIYIGTDGSENDGSGVCGILFQPVIAN